MHNVAEWWIQVPNGGVSTHQLGISIPLLSWISFISRSWCHVTAVIDSVGAETRHVRTPLVVETANRGRSLSIIGAVEAKCSDLIQKQ
ncbi:hypothetical protein C5167_010589 [Papaver somniferum]|uniref:Uncharacterized protein n=1 Tax=Papaver somniferum TaxID=3469 RepID=A0A4Y7K3H8_PAPSO|nr:hypothetical protein C5167_010589 [Papaver somniferum]